MVLVLNLLLVFVLSLLLVLVLSLLLIFVLSLLLVLVLSLFLVFALSLLLVLVLSLLLVFVLSLLLAFVLSLFLVFVLSLFLLGILPQLSVWSLRSLDGCRLRHIRRGLTLLDALCLGLGGVGGGLALAGEVILYALLLAGGLHLLLHGLEHLGVPALLPGQGGIVRAGQRVVFILGLGQLRLGAVAGLNALEGLGGGAVPVLPGVPLLGLDEIFVPVAVVLALVEGPLPQLGLVGVDLGMLQGIALIGVVALMGHGVENLHVGVGHRLGIGIAGQGTAFQQVFIEADGVPSRIPAAEAAVPQGGDLHGLGRTALLIGKVVLQSLDRLAFGVVVQGIPGPGGKEVVELGPVGGELLRGGVEHAGAVKGGEELLVLVCLGLLRLGLFPAEEIGKPSHGTPPSAEAVPAGAAGQQGQPVGGAALQHIEQLQGLGGSGAGGLHDLLQGAAAPLGIGQGTVLRPGLSGLAEGGGVFVLDAPGPGPALGGGGQLTGDQLGGKGREQHNDYLL